MNLLRPLSSFGTFGHVANEVFPRDTQHLMDSALDVLHTVLSPHRVEILGIEPDRSFQCLGFRDASERSGKESRRPLAGQALARRAIDSQRVVADDIISLDAKIGATRLRCVVAPILGSHGCSGVIAVHWLPSHRPTKSEVNRVVLIANGLSNTLNRIEALEHRHNESKKIEAFGRSTGELAHDFGNVLTVIQGYAQFLFEDVDADKRELIERILVAGKRGQILLRQFLAFARGGLPRPEIFDLNEIVGELIPSLAAVAGDRVDLEFDPGPELESVTFDRDQIAQVLTILVTNAKEAMPEGGTVAIRTSDVSMVAEASPRRPGLPLGSYARLTVQDSGIGMTSTEQTRVFEPFFTTKEGGAQDARGLGLATAYGILKQAGGYVYLSSEPGAGTTFDIYLPTTPGRAAPSPPSDSTTRATINDQIRA